jgi:UPF0716 protein FxsA
MAKLLLLFTVVPIVVLVLLLDVGRRIGTAATLLLILITGIVGAVLARRQGVAALRYVRAELADGQLPGPAIVDGVLILVAGALLITPGVLTDVVGFLCLVPAARRSIRALLLQAFMRAAGRGMVTVDARFVDWREPRDQRFAGRSSTTETNDPRSRRSDGPSPEEHGSRRT